MPLPNSEEAIEPVNSFSPPDEYAALLQRASEVSNIKILKEKYREAVSSRSPTKKHCRSSESPERKPAKVRRNYKFLPTRDDGKVEVPVILGRGVHRTILLEFGELCPLPSFRKGDFIFPVGFLSKRKYYTYDSNLGLEKPQKFEFGIGLESDFDELEASKIDDFTQQLALGSYEIFDSDQDLDALWSRFKNKFDPLILTKLDEDFKGPEAFLGLEHDSLAKYIKQMSSEAH